LRNKFNEIWSILSQILEEKEIEAAIFRSIAGCLESLLLAQDAQKWNDSLARKAFTSLLLLSVDRRPKVIYIAIMLCWLRQTVSFGWTNSDEIYFDF